MTPAELARHTLAWTRRRKEQTKAYQMLAYNMAALITKAQRGKLKPYEKEFPERKQQVTESNKEDLKRDFKKFSNFLKEQAEKKKHG